MSQYSICYFHTYFLLNSDKNCNSIMTVSNNKEDIYDKHKLLENNESEEDIECDDEVEEAEDELDEGIQTSVEVNKKKKIMLINELQNEMDHLFYEWNSINIVLESTRNAFSVKDLTPEYLDQVDKELGIAYDDLRSQVRHLERRLKKMYTQVNQQLFEKAITELNSKTATSNNENQHN